jgi:predicted ribosomally synthesized peptide with SipW-like signal peptide
MKKKIAILLLIEIVVGLYAVSAIYANFSDVAESKGNVFTAGTWGACGELMDFIVPEHVIQGQTISFSIIFHNCGDIATSQSQMCKSEGVKAAKI